MRRQLRYLFPAVAAAAMVVAVVRYGGLLPGAPTPTVPTTVREPATGDSAGRRVAKGEPESDGRGRPGAGSGGGDAGTVAPAPAPKVAEGAAAARRVQEESNRIAEAPAPPAPPAADERNATAARGERDRLADRTPLEADDSAPRYRAAAPAGIDAPAPAAESQLAARKESASGTGPGKEQAAGAPAAALLGNARSKADPSPLASASPRLASPCELARDLAARGRYRDAETAQRACLAKDRTSTAQEKGLVFLAELLDRQDRFADADAVLAEVRRQFPESRPLDLYRQQRPMIQRQPTGVPALSR